MFGKLRKLSVLVLVFVLVASALAAVRAATISNEVWSNVIADEGDIEIIPGYPAELNLTILANSGDPFTAATFPQADSVTVVGKFVDEYGNAIDVTGDGTADVFSFTEDANTPGLWTTTITVQNVTPGVYTFKVEAIAQNTTTGEIFDNVTMEKEIVIAGGPYWILVADVKDGDTIKIGSLNFTIAGLSDVGAILDFGNLNTMTVSDDDRDGVMAVKVDALGDGTADDWLVFVKTDDDSHVLFIYSNSETLLDNLYSELDGLDVRAKGDRVLFGNKLFKDGSNYKAYVVWDDSLLAKLGIKAVDYYIIPVKGKQNWWERWRYGGAYERVKVIKRTTYLGGLFGNEEVVFDGNIFGKWVKTKDGAIRLLGRWNANMASFAYRMWEIRKAFGNIEIPKGYTLKERDLRELAVSGEDWRGFNPITEPSGRGLFKPSIDWANLLGFEITEEEDSS